MGINCFAPRGNTSVHLVGSAWSPILDDRIVESRHFARRSGHSKIALDNAHHFGRAIGGEFLGRSASLTPALVAFQNSAHPPHWLGRESSANQIVPPQLPVGVYSYADNLPSGRPDFPCSGPPGCQLISMLNRSAVEGRVCSCGHRSRDSLPKPATVDAGKRCASVTSATSLKVGRD